MGPPMINAGVGPGGRGLGECDRQAAEERAKGQAWGLQTIKSFHTKGTPPVPGFPES